MRILSWNMRNCARAWDYLRERQEEFDVALLQETPDPASSVLNQHASVVFSPKGHGQWGSAVVAWGLELEAIDLEDEFFWLQELRTAVAIARTPGDPVWLASVHFSHAPAEIAGREERLPADLQIVTKDRSIWETDLVPLELRKLFGDKTFLWGGDLNSAEAMDEVPSFKGGNKRLREIWREAGCIDLRTEPEEQRTYFVKGKGPYQLDHVFGDASTKERVRSWSVDPDPVQLDPPLSDHAPILVELAPAS